SRCPSSWRRRWPSSMPSKRSWLPWYPGGAPSTPPSHGTVRPTCWIFWWQFINELIGLDEVDELVSLAQWALTMITDGTDSDNIAEKVMATRLTETSAVRLREAMAKRDSD